MVVRGLTACSGTRQPIAAGYGDLLPVASANTGETLLALPPGFHYTVFGRTGEPMSDGRPTPADHDGMAAFPSPDGIRLVRNHECSPGTPAQFRAIGAPERSYDRRSPGGTTTLVIDPRTRLPAAAFVSLSGTFRNCAGGPTPWGSWISCEEGLAGPTQGLEQAHGYCFEVPAGNAHEADPLPLKAMGRFVHEAVAVDPATGFVYETEDDTSAGFYRFVPVRKGQLAAGGRLEMLAVAGRAGYDTRTGQRVGEQLRVRWVGIDQADPAIELGGPAVFAQGAARGGATFGRLEGCWYGGGHIFLNVTNGGDARLGQVWRYTPDGQDEGELTLLFESTSPQVLQSPDNLCVSPRGGLVLCEDGPEENFIRGLTKEGQVFDFARNLDPRNSEFAGATFSPDGATLFLNVQTPGYTLGIWGDWSAGAL
jgi:secreted PhoX family phosphatase